MKTLITIAAAALICTAPGIASAKQHVLHHQVPNAADFYALSPSAPHAAPVDDGSCIGLSSGTSAPSCGATLTGGPSGGLN